jgi:hypothetical protein
VKAGVWTNEEEIAQKKEQQRKRAITAEADKRRQYEHLKRELGL